MFGIEKEDLKDLLTKADKGQLQLPDFQRDYVWTDEDVRSLIASVAKGYPVGALLTLQTGGEVDFKPRVLEGVSDHQTKPEELLLDGQQRMTSLYQAAFSKAAVRTQTPRRTEVDRFYYINICEALSSGAKEKIARWFWSVTLGELFGSSTESRLARDVPELVDWIRGTGGEPRALNEAVFQQERLRSLRMRLSAAYKGIHTLLMQDGCRDFVSGKPTDIMTFFNDRIDIHHVFPQKWCKDHGIDPRTFNSIINKTPLSAASNREIGGDAPSKYLKRIEEKHGLTSDQLDSILGTHLIEPDHLRNDDFYTFFQARRDTLSDIIWGAMGKPVVLEAGHDEEEREVDIDDDDLDRETV